MADATVVAVTTGRNDVAGWRQWLSSLDHIARQPMDVVRPRQSPSPPAHIRARASRIGPAVLGIGAAVAAQFSPLTRPGPKSSRIEQETARSAIIREADVPADVPALGAFGRGDLDDALVDIVELGAQRSRHHGVLQVERRDVGELEQLGIRQVRS